MNLRFLETFLWVAKLKSFSLAAEKLHATQAAVSSRIATSYAELLCNGLGRIARKDKSGDLLLADREPVSEMRHADGLRELAHGRDVSLLDQVDLTFGGDRKIVAPGLGYQDLSVRQRHSRFSCTLQIGRPSVNGVAGRAIFGDPPQPWRDR